MVQFNEDEAQNLSKNVRKISSQLRQQLKQVEKKIRLYINDELSDADNDLQFQIKDNMSQNILTELNTFSKKFKLNQELYSKKYKEFAIEEDNNNALELYDISTNNSDLNDNINNVNNNDPGENFLMTEEPDQLLQRRDSELNEIVRGVTNLQEMFKDLHVIVIEQGSILDRIDYNIDIGFNNVSKGKKKIISANEHHKSSCFRNIILFLLICIFVESILILFKFL
jgi:syntaxin 16